MTIEGQVIAKSVVGEAQFAVFKGMADKLEKAQTEIAKERDLRENAEFCKRADDVYKHVPGSTQERADMLKAISKMPEALQKSFEAVLTQSEKLAKSAFETIGTMVSKQDKDASETFEKSVSEIRKRDNCTRAEALQKARKENPEGFKAYQQAGN